MSLMRNALLDYGHRRSRRGWWVMAAAMVVVLGVATVFTVRAWRLHRERVEDLRLLAEQRAYRQELERAMLHPINKPSTRPYSPHAGRSTPGAPRAGAISVRIVLPLAM